MSASKIGQLHHRLIAEEHFSFLLFSHSLQLETHVPILRSVLISSIYLSIKKKTCSFLGSSVSDLRIPAGQAEGNDFHLGKQHETRRKDLPWHSGFHSAFAGTHPTYHSQPTSLILQ